MDFLKKYWKYSRFRFYWLNLSWNVSFWLFAKKVYKDYQYQVKTEDFYMDEYGIIRYKTEPKSRRRFVGYMFRGNIYLDNPGFEMDDIEVLRHWEKRGFIKF